MDLSVFKNYKEEEEKKGNGGTSEEIFMPEFDDKGKQDYILRFLPQFDEKGKLSSEVFFAELWRKHNFKGSDVGSDGFFNKICPRTINKECYICDNSSEIHDTSKKLYGKVKARISYIFVVEVVQYKADPSQEGKIKFYYGSKNFFDKQLLPELTDELEPNPLHDLKKGCSVGISVTKTDKGRDFTTKFYKTTDISKRIKEKDIPNIKEWINGKVEKILKKDPMAFDYDYFKATYLNMFPALGNTNKVLTPKIEVQREPTPTKLEPAKTDSSQENNGETIDIDELANSIVGD